MPFFKEEKFTFDKLIVTAPSQQCKDIDWQGFDERDKMIPQLDAFRTLSTEPIFKVSLQFKERFWENKEIMGDFAVIGGAAKTDLPSRQVVFPSYGYEAGPKAPGTVLIYNFMTDAVGFGGMSKELIVQQALDDMTTMYKAFACD